MSRKKTFEEKMDELETIVTELGNGSAGLSAAASLYEKGMKLVSELETELEAVSEKVKLLRVSADGSDELSEYGENSENEQ